MMDLSNIFNSISFVIPEIALSITIVLTVLFDLIFDKDKKIIPYIVLIGLLVTGYFVFAQMDFANFGFTVGDEKYGMFTLDGFSNYFKIIILITTIIIIFFSSHSNEIIKTFDRSGEYYALLLGMALGMMFMVSASDLILIYLSVELLSLSSYVLTGFTKLSDRNAEASLKYLIYGSVSSGLMLFGISIVYGLTGTTNLYELNTLLQAGSINLTTLGFSLILIFVGIGYKISAAPFHFWTPDVYEGAPISITAYLSVASKAAGFALLIRFIKTSFVSYTDASGNWHLLGIFDWQTLLIIIAILTMTLGNFSALSQSNLKRMLAYSSIAHAGYLLLGLAVLSDQGLLAVLIYFFIYMIMNLGAFFIVNLIANKINSEDIHDYDGIGYTSPLLGVSLAIFLVSLTGLPPTAGFIAKLYLFIALVDANMITVAVIALLNTVVSLYYYVRVLKHMYLNKANESTQAVIPTLQPRIIVLALVIPVLLFGIYFTPIVSFAQNCLNILTK